MGMPPATRSLKRRRLNLQECTEGRRSVPGRLGGEEFAILLPHVDRDGAVAAAEKVRALVAAQTISTGGRALNVTASFGISALSIVGKDIETLLAQADAAMYKAKHTGRNRCISWSSLQAEHAVGARRRVPEGGAPSCSMTAAPPSTAPSSRSEQRQCRAAGVQFRRHPSSRFLLSIKGEGFETRCQVSRRRTGKTFESGFPLASQALTRTLPVVMYLSPA